MKKFLLLAALFASPAFAAFPSHEDVRAELNQSPVGARVQLGTQLQDKKIQVLVAKYDFSVDGGAVGIKNLKDVDGKKAVLPAGAIIKDCLLMVDTTVTSAGTAYIGLSTGNKLDDLRGSTVLASNFAPSDQVKACDIVGTAASSVKLPGPTDGYTSEYTPTMKIAGAALTGGKFRVFIQYLLSQ